MTASADFITRYGPSDAPRVAFAWNGKHAADLQDSNLEFRRAVVKEVLARPEVAPPELLHALVDAETAFAAEAWGTNLWVHTLAEQMLIRGGASTVPDFLRFRTRGMDAHCELSRVSLPPGVAAEYEAFCVSRLAATDAPGETKLFMEGARFFKAVAELARRQSG